LVLALVKYYAIAGSQTALVHISKHTLLKKALFPHIEHSPSPHFALSLGNGKSFSSQSSSFPIHKEAYTQGKKERNLHGLLNFYSYLD